MDNLTHSLVGLAASKAGLEKLSPHTSALCILASNAPDSDIVALLFGGRWSFLQHHRGITHSMLGTPNRTAPTTVVWLRVFWIGALVLLFVLSRLRIAQRWGSRIAIAAFVILTVYMGGLA